MPAIALLVKENLSWLIKVVTSPRNIEFSCGLALFTLLYSILKSCEWKCECESCESKMPNSPTKRSRRRESPFTKEQEIWIVRRRALMTPTQLRRSFINQLLNPKKSYHLAPRPFAFTRANNTAAND